MVSPVKIIHINNQALNILLSSYNSHNWNVIRTALAMGGYPNIARLDKAANQLRTM